jgi:hypothetical protein
VATKKQLQEERALEKTVLQAESIAGAFKHRDPYVAGAEGCNVICPECGQLVPSPYDSFISQTEADKYALKHCDCQNQRKVIALTKKADQKPTDDSEVMPREQLLSILFTPAPDNRPKLKVPHMSPQFGACRFCGQAQSAYGCQTEEQADEYATRRCKCLEAGAYQEKLDAQEERAEALREVSNNLQSLFPNVKAEAMALLTMAAAAIYDRKLVSESIKLSYTVSAKISRNTKGNISIERKDATAQKIEV